MSTRLIKLQQLYWSKESAVPVVLPVVINPAYIIFATEDEMVKDGPLILFQKNVERCTAVMMENVDKPIFVIEPVDVIIKMVHGILPEDYVYEIPNDNPSDS